MKKLFLITVFSAIAGFASAQMAAVDSEVAANLKLAITVSGHECAQVVNVEPIGNDGAKITCVLADGGDATGIYVFAVSADGLSITKE